MTNITMENIWKVLTENRSIEIEADLSSDLVCTACKKIMIKPCNVPCGCRYCSKCLENYLIGKERLCLGDSDYCKVEPINFDKNVFPDQAANMKISRLIVKCPLGSCEFRSQFNKLEEHIRTCNKESVDCPYQAVGCSKIKADVAKMKTHFLEEDYFHARLLMEFMGNWENEVRMLKTQVLELCEENKHLREERESSKEDSKQNLVLIAQDMITPLSLKNKSLKQELETIRLNEKSNQEAIQALDKVIVQLTQENNSLRNEMAMLKLVNKATQGTALSMKQKMETQIRDSMRLEKRLTENQKLVDRIQAQIKSKNGMQNSVQKPKTATNVNEFKLTSSLANKKFGEFMWLINKWDHKRTQAREGKKTVLRSDIFYTHERGYKLALEIHPNGSSNFFGSYLGLFICVMNGEFDKTLDWPFRLEVKLELMNQETGLAHVSKPLDYSDIASLNETNNPTKSNYKNIGLRSFIPLDEIGATPSLCLNNQIWIRIRWQMPQMNAFHGFAI